MWKKVEKIEEKQLEQFVINLLNFISSIFEQKQHTYSLITLWRRKRMNKRKYREDKRR